MKRVTGFGRGGLVGNCLWLELGLGLRLGIFFGLKTRVWVTIGMSLVEVLKLSLTCIGLVSVPHRSSLVMSVVKG